MGERLTLTDKALRLMKFVEKCDKPHVTRDVVESYLRDVANDAFDRGRAQGRKDMAEEAAAVCEREFEPHIAVKIRALADKETK